jgi:hypothetical protein
MGTIGEKLLNVKKMTSSRVIVNKKFEASPVL